MKYQFITIIRDGYFEEEIISEKTLKEYIRGFTKEEVQTFGKGWYGYEGREYDTYLWKKIA